MPPLPVLSKDSIAESGSSQKPITVFKNRTRNVVVGMRQRNLQHQFFGPHDFRFGSTNSTMAVYKLNPSPSGILQRFSFCKFIFIFRPPPLPKKETSRIPIEHNLDDCQIFEPWAMADEAPKDPEYPDELKPDADAEKPPAEAADLDQFLQNQHFFIKNLFFTKTYSCEKKRPDAENPAEEAPNEEDAKGEEANDDKADDLRKFTKISGRLISRQSIL